MFASTILSLISVAVASPSYSLEVVESYTTYLPEATTLVENNQTYTVTGPTNLTVTNCPCTRTHTYNTKTVTTCANGSAPVMANNTSSGPALANGASKQSVGIAFGVAAAALLI